MYLPWAYEYYTSKKLDLDNPVEFNQKLQWLKAFYHPKILNQLVDKYAVREYVIEKIGSQYLNELYGVYNSFSEIDFDKLPNEFVLKAVHASSYNIICRDKSKLNLKKVKRTVRKWQATNQYYRTGQEWAYKDVKPRLIAEKYLEDKETEDLIDYKFYCFGGKPKFLVAQSSSVGKYFYDLNWVECPFRWRIKYHKSVSKPSNFEELKELAVKLAADFPFVRVDFYSVDGKAYFGEMTFYPTDGRDDFYPKEYNKIIGDMIKLPDLKGRKVIK
ncbi:ATP-grasp fold amidoligase family protein [Tenacibaculum gallaicum]|nr:ATP-grasp fold amidoligase family protein [Tenacibaculum gallaicum]